MVALDFKKELREFYLPKTEPALVTVPTAHFLSVRGIGDPNEPNGAYSQALGMLYALAYTIKMSYKSTVEIEGYYPYVVPPLEGLWWMADGSAGVNYADKSHFCWISMLRQPDFVTPEVLAWAKQEVRRKKKLDADAAQLFDYEEGCCVQCMHIGPYDDEPATLAKLDAFAQAQGYLPDFVEMRHHHEIYLGDPRKTAPEKLKTVLRHPVRQA